MANAPTPLKIKFRDCESALSPLHTYGSAEKKLTSEHLLPLGHLFLEDADTRGTLFRDDGDFDTDVELRQNLSLNNTPLDPDKRTAPLLVHGEWTKIELQGTSTQPFIDAHDNADVAAAVACVKALFDELTNEFSAALGSSMKKKNIANHFKVTSARGGVVVTFNGVKFAVCMLGPCLPKLDDLARILKKPNVPGHIKKIEWMKGGALGMTSMSIKKNPEKVCTTRCRVIRCRVIRCRAPRCRALTRVTLLSTSPFTGASKV